MNAYATLYPSCPHPQPRRARHWLVLALCACFGVAAWADGMPPPDPNAPAAEAGKGSEAAKHATSTNPAPHRLLLLGKDLLFVYQMLDYQAPQNQVLAARVQIVDSKEAEKLREARGKVPPNQYALFTVETEKLDWTAFGPEAKDPPTRFKASIYSGMVGKKGELLQKDVEFEVKKVLQLAPLDAKASRDKLVNYAFFGEGREWFACHLLGGAPDFDQVMQVELETSRGDRPEALVWHQGRLGYRNDDLARLIPGAIAVLRLDEIRNQVFRVI